MVCFDSRYISLLADFTHHTDTAVLNFALTLEHLENTFYSQGLAKLNAQDFANAGFQPWVRQRFQQIANHEATHVQFLQKALGDKATQPCEYNLYVYVSSRVIPTH